jgi:Flp pilus assembly protein TadD
MLRRAPAWPAVLLLFLGAGAVRAGPVEDAKALAKGDRPSEAAALLRARTDAFPADAAAFVALGEVERLRCRLASAEEAYRLALERDLSDAGARAGLGEVLLLRGRAEEALGEAQAGIDGARAGEREDERPWRVKALALVELRRYDLAVEAAHRATALAPGNARCHEALAAAEFRSGRIDRARAAYRRALDLDPRSEEANLRLGNGFADAVHGKPWAAGAERDAFRAALAAWEEGELERSQAAWLELSARWPDVYKYRLGLGLVRLAVRRRNEAYLGGDAGALYEAIPAPEIADLRKVIRGVDGLTSVERRVVCVSTAPARPFWPALVAAGVTHDLIPLDADLTDDAGRRDLLGQRTFDGRWYEHLRGVGGAQAATGTEKLREAADFAFNTFAHEFGHQVHRKGLSDAQQKEVDRLYADAVKASRCLDYYAASNADEYFAQGYEAFVSPLKRGCLTETARHTRTELAAKDPPLYEFLWRILDTSHESPETLARLRAAADRSSTVAPDVQPEPAGR